jgi:hypothetical protein
MAHTNELVAQGNGTADNVGAVSPVGTISQDATDNVGTVSQEDVGALVAEALAGLSLEPEVGQEVGQEAATAATATAADNADTAGQILDAPAEGQEAATDNQEATTLPATTLPAATPPTTPPATALLPRRSYRDALLARFAALEHPEDYAPRSLLVNRAFIQAHNATLEGAGAPERLGYIYITTPTGGSEYRPLGRFDRIPSNPRFFALRRTDKRGNNVFQEVFPNQEGTDYGTPNGPFRLPANPARTLATSTRWHLAGESERRAGLEADTVPAPLPGVAPILPVVAPVAQEVTTAGQEAALEAAPVTSALPATTPVGEGPTAGTEAPPEAHPEVGPTPFTLTVAADTKELRRQGDATPPVVAPDVAEANGTAADGQEDHTTLETLYIRRTIKGRQRYLPVVGADLDRVRADGGTLYRQVGSGKARRYFPINGAGAIND